MAKFSKEMTMGEILAIDPKAREVLEGFGMHCCGCPISQAEALQDACAVHDVDVELVLEELEELEELERAEGCECGCGEHCECTEDDNCGCTCWEEDECDCDDCDDDECDCGCNQ